jgi:ABC-2 type transport system ATP-binding protein
MIRALPQRGGACDGRMDTLLDIDGLEKTYASGVRALHPTRLSVRRGEIFALLGPNGAGKTTLIGCVCGLVTPSGGAARVDGLDVVRDARRARARIGLVPQELATDMFETPWATLRLSRGLFGLPPDAALLERTLRELSLWDKRDARIQTLSGGMKRRVMIAKALVHEPRLLFLDEPTAGVDVELRRDLWALVGRLRDAGTTIVLTTHYIEEAQAMADRVGVILGGELVLVEDKAALLRRFGRKQLTVQLQAPLASIPPALDGLGLERAADGLSLVHAFDAGAEHSGIPAVLRRLDEAGIAFRDLHTRESSLEDIFVDLVQRRREERA